MTSQKLAGFLKSHWPLAVIAVAVAVLAFAAGALTSNRGAADERTPASGASPPYTPSPPTPLPANAAGEASASACDGFLAPSGICIPETTPGSSPGWGPVYSGVEITLSGGRKLQLPSDVYIAGVIDNVYCGPIINNTPTPCPPPPLYTLKKGNSVVAIDFDGNIDGDGNAFRPADFPSDFFAISEGDVWDPAAFPFLPVSRNGD